MLVLEDLDGKFVEIMSLKILTCVMFIWPGCDNFHECKNKVLQVVSLLSIHFSLSDLGKYWFIHFMGFTQNRKFQFFLGSETKKSGQFQLNRKSWQLGKTTSEFRKGSQSKQIITF